MGQSLTPNFRSLKKSDKIEVLERYLNDYAGLLDELVAYLSGDAVARSPEGYRVQRIGEFIGEIFSKEQLESLEGVLQTLQPNPWVGNGDIDIKDFFLEGIEIGKTQTRVKAKNQVRRKIVSPDGKITDTIHQAS